MFVWGWKNVLFLRGSSARLREKCFKRMKQALLFPKLRYFVRIELKSRRNHSRTFTVFLTLKKKLQGS